MTVSRFILNALGTSPSVPATTLPLLNVTLVTVSRFNASSSGDRRVDDRHLISVGPRARSLPSISRLSLSLGPCDAWHRFLAWMWIWTVLRSDTVVACLVLVGIDDNGLGIGWVIAHFDCRPSSAHWAFGSTFATLHEHYDDRTYQ